MIARFFDSTSSGNFRSLFPWENKRYSEHLLRLPAEDRRIRFLGGVGDDFIVDHARRKLSSSRTKIIGWFHHGILCGTAELCWSESRVCEAAFSVDPMHRRCGIGTALASRAIRAARNRGVTQLVILTEASNVSMRRLGARFGATFLIDGREVKGTIETGQANMLSVIFEITEEYCALASTALTALPEPSPEPAYSLAGGVQGYSNADRVALPFSRGATKVNSATR